MPDSSSTERLVFLFTDVEGSSRLWEEHTEEMEAALAAHDEIVQREVGAGAGTIVKGTGDGFMAVFAEPADAITASVAIQRQLGAATFDSIGSVPVRMGIHVGHAEPRDGDYYGPAVNRAARLMGIGHGGQILASAAVNDATADLPAPIRLRSLGEHRLRDLTAPEHVFQVEHPELRAEFPPLNSLDAFANNLPSMLDSFVGREDELERIVELLGEARLVTLTGPGGTGKTRLGVEAAARCITDFPWGAWIVDLAPLTDESQVASAIAETIGIEPQPGRDVVDTLVGRLSDRGMLIVLDNCEHVAGSSADTVRRILERCPSIKVLATSRQHLGIAGEHVLAIEPLETPDRTDLDAATLLAFPAARLFADRAVEARATWELDDSDAPFVARICGAVEGIPLAIELAAARIRVLTVAQIADRLDQQLSLLSTAVGTGDRHEALKATIDWSYDLTDEAERRLFRRLSVFRGGADLDAIEAVAAGVVGGLVLDALDGLHAKSMIIAEDRGRGMRYRLLEPLRQYAADRLGDEGEEGEAFAAHWDWFLGFAGEVNDGIRGPDQLDWLARTELDYDNLRVAMSRAYEAGEVETCISLAASLSWFMFLHSHVEDWELWLPRLVQHADGADPMNMARLRLGAAQYAWELSRIDEAKHHATKALVLADVLDSETMRAWAHTYLALIGALAVELDDVPSHLDTAEAIFAAKGNTAGLGNVMWLRAFFTILQVDLGVMAVDARLDNLRNTIQIVVDGARLAGDRNLLGHTLWTSAWAALLAGDVEVAKEESAMGTRALYELGNHYCLSHNLLVAGHIALSDGDPVRAATLLSAAEGIKDRLGVTGSPLDVQTTERLRGALGEAMDEAALAEALEEGRRLAVATAVGLATDGIGHQEHRLLDT